MMVRDVQCSEIVKCDRIKSDRALRQEGVVVGVVDFVRRTTDVILRISS